MKRNEDLTFSIEPSQSSPEKISLFKRFFDERFPENELGQLTDGQLSVLFAGFSHMGIARDNQGQLLAFSLIDVTPNGIAGGQIVYDLNESRRGLGTSMDLWTALYAQSQGISYFYLGPWAAESSLKHKAQYNGLEVHARHKIGITAGWMELSELSSRHEPEKAQTIFDSLNLNLP